MQAIEPNSSLCSCAFDVRDTHFSKWCFMYFIYLVVRGLICVSVRCVIRLCTLHVHHIIFILRLVCALANDARECVRMCACVTLHACLCVFINVVQIIYRPGVYAHGVFYVHSIKKRDVLCEHYEVYVHWYYSYIIVRSMLQTFVVVARDRAIYRFSAQSGFWILSPFNPLRRVAIYVLTHPYPFGVQLYCPHGLFETICVCILWNADNMNK